MDGIGKNSIDLPTNAEIVVPFFNRSDLVTRCLESILLSTPHCPNIILVDDGSFDFERKAVEQWCSENTLPHEFVTNGSNLGYKESIHSGIERCSRRFAILLNSDTVVTSQFSKQLLEPLLCDGSVGAVGPVSNYLGDLFQYRPEVDLRWSDSRPLERAVATIGDDSRRRHTGVLTEVPYLTAMCLAVETATFKAVGKFCDEYEHGFFEDLALSCKLRARGRRLLVREDCFVYHQGNATYQSQTVQEETHERVRRNHEVFVRRWGHLPEHEELETRMWLAGKRHATEPPAA